MPLSAKGLWEAETTAAGAPSVADHQATSGVGSDAQADDVDPLGGQAGGQRGLEQRPGPARVAADGEPLAAQHPGRGAAEGERRARA